MTLDPEKNRRLKVIRWMACVLLVLFCTAGLSCSFLPKSYRKTPQKMLRDSTASSHYSKKIGISAIPNFAFIKNQELEKIFEQVMVETIQAECTNVEIITSQNAEGSELLTAPPTLESNIIDNFALAEAGRREGYNAIVTGALETITTRKERKGIWWWRKTHHYLQILAFIDVFDPYDAAKIFSDPIFAEFKISGKEFEKIKAGQQIELPAMQQQIKEMAVKAGNSICAAVGSRIWKGFVISADEKRVTLSCGENRGIRPGSQFEVYDSSRTMEGQGGQKFYVPGFKIGEIEVSRASKTQSEAKVLTEKPVPVGSVVIPKS